ncbi:MAG: helix-turn-helix transcriptional regulator [Oscillospiraceae bacterium]|jgi:PadR family transcriptional regulator PadR|nr:helix-turn-helix transcriptional regulator [Oscillospiraceae bacterium]
MAHEKNSLSGHTTMLILKLLESKDLYGYQIIEELAQRSEDLFCLKTGTLYPILHGLERDDMVSSYEKNADSARVRRYYRLTGKGKGLLSEKQSEWTTYATAVNRIMEGGVRCATA